MGQIVIPEQVNELTNSGWYLYEKCRCGGKLKYKYRNMQYPTIEVRWYPNFYSFTIIDNNKTLVAMTPIGRLTQKLQEVLHVQAV